MYIVVRRYLIEKDRDPEARIFTTRSDALKYCSSALGFKEHAFGEEMMAWDGDHPLCLDDGVFVMRKP